VTANGPWSAPCPEPVAAPEPEVVSEPVAVAEPVTVAEPVVEPEPVVSPEPVSPPAPAPAFTVPPLADRVVATVEAADTPVVRIDEPSSEAIEVPVRETVSAIPVTPVPEALELEEAVVVEEAAVKADTVPGKSSQDAEPEPEPEPDSRSQPGPSLGLIDDFSGGTLQPSRRTQDADDDGDQAPTDEAEEPTRRRFRIRFNFLFLLALPAGGLAAYHVTQQLSRGTQRPAPSPAVADGRSSIPTTPLSPVVPVNPVPTTAAQPAPATGAVTARAQELPPPPPVDEDLALLITPLPDLPAPVPMPVFVAPVRPATSTSPAPAAAVPSAVPAVPPAPVQAQPPVQAEPPAPAPQPEMAMAAVQPRPAAATAPQTVQLSMDPSGRIAVGGDMADPAVRRHAQQWALQQTPPPAGLDAMAISRIDAPAVVPSTRAVAPDPREQAPADPYADLPESLREPLRQQVQNLLVSERLERRLRVLPAGRVTLNSPLATSRRVENIPVVMFTDGQIVLLKPPSDSSLMGSIQAWADAQPLPPEGFVTPMVLSFQPKA